jgi:hypothetical protein
VKGSRALFDALFGVWLTAAVPTELAVALSPVGGIIQSPPLFLLFLLFLL